MSTAYLVDLATVFHVYVKTGYATHRNRSSTTTYSETKNQQVIVLLELEQVIM
jgi:hypothetical protein